MPNIDRDDENATRYETKQTIDEQFPNLSALAQGAMSGNITEWPQLRVEAQRIIEAYKRITEAAGRPEPVGAQHRFRHPQKTMPDWSEWQPCTIADRPAWEIDSVGYAVEYRNIYGPDLLDYADRMRAERDAERDRGDQWEITATNLLNRAEAAERQLAELQAKHDALVKRLTEAVCPHCNNTGCVEVPPVAVCCNRPLSNGECCGSPVPEQTQEQCQWCAERESMSAVALDKGGE